MAMASFVQTAFHGGEWSQVMQGRSDRPDYRTSMNVCINGIPISEGAWTRRPGFMLSAHTRGGAEARVLPFVQKQNAPFTLETTDGYMRFYAGNSLVTTNDAQIITALSGASPAVATTTTAHGWTTGNQGMFGNLGTSCPTLLNRQVILTVTDTTHFSITDALTGANIDGSTLTLPAGATFSRFFELTTPYVGNSWSTLRLVQADKGGLLFNTQFAPQVLTVTPATPTANATFALTPAAFLDGPYLDPFTSGALLTPSATTGIIGLTVSFAAYDSTRSYTNGDFVTASTISYQSLADQNLNNTPSSSPTKWAVVPASLAIGPNGFVATDVGRHIRLCNEPPLWLSGTSYSSGNLVTYNNGYYTSLANSNAGNIPGTDLTHWAIAPNAAIWTWGKITGLQNQIANSLSGSTSLGNMGTGAFSGIDAQGYSASSNTSLANSGSPVPIAGYVGRNFSGASDQKILFATAYPSTDFGFFSINFTPETGNFTTQNLTINLRAKASSPSSGSDGTLLGSYSYAQLGGGQNPLSTLGTTPVTITSNDQSTAWKYVWFELVGQWTTGITDRSITGYLAVGQAKFFGPAGVSSNGVSVEILGANLLNTNVIRTWRLGLFNRTVGWPTCGTYHEGRIWIAGSVNNRFDGSKPNQDITKGISFSPTEPNGAVTGSSAIDYTLNAPTTNSILSMKPDQQGIVIYTEHGEWLVQATTVNQPLTVTNIQAHQVTRIGSSITSSAEPLQCDHTTLFIQRYDLSLMEYFADVFSGKFSAPDLALPAKHLTSRALQEIAYQQTISPVVWARCADGSLLGCSYKRDSLMSSQGPSFAGWHQHVHGGGRSVTSICAGPSPDGTLDTLAAVTTSDSNVAYIEFLSTLFKETDVLPDAKFLDSAIVPTVAQNIVLGGISTMQLSGLWPLIGQLVSVFAGGLDLGDYTVDASGRISVPYGTSNALFTASFVSGYAGTLPVVVGYTYTSDGQLLRPATMQDTGARNGPGFAKLRRIHQFAIQLVNTLGISFGTDFAATRLTPAVFKSAGGRALPANTLYSGIFRDTIKGNESYDEMLCWRITRPFPATVTAIGGFIETKDS